MGGMDEMDGWLNGWMDEMDGWDGEVLIIGMMVGWSGWVPKSLVSGGTPNFHGVFFSRCFVKAYFFVFFRIWFGFGRFGEAKMEVKILPKSMKSRIWRPSKKHSKKWCWKSRKMSSQEVPKRLPKSFEIQKSRFPKWCLEKSLSQDGCRTPPNTHFGLISNVLTDVYSKRINGIKEGE